MTDKSDSLIVSEDGSLELGDSIEKIVFHQNLNVFLVLTKENTIRVFDPHSSHKLADVPLAKYVTDSEEFIKCLYHSETGAIVLSGGKSLGIRHHHQGVLLLNTILQTQVTSSDEIVTLEILLSEALQLQQVLWELNNIENASELKEALAQAISEPQSQTCTNPKVGKWRTVCLTLPLGTLRRVFTSLVSELRNLAYFIPALSLASALVHRLYHLSPSLSTTDDGELDKDSMFSEAARLATFNKWPHMNYKWALPEQMAQAGFFYQPVTSDDDRATCFICNVCLVYWEPTDEPWSEHERHSPSCPYVKGEYTHNVPLSVTHASTPAFTHSDKAENIHRISQSNSNLFLATATKTGNIVVWNIAKQWKKEVSFMIDPSNSTILDKHFSDTIGYTDAPLRPESPEQIYFPLKSSTLKHMESAAKSYSMYSNMMSPLNGNLNSEKLMKEDLDNSLSQLFDDMPSDIHSLYTDSSPSEANPKKWSKKKYLVGIKPIMPIDELNDIESLNLEEVLQLENLMDEEVQSESTNEIHTNLQSANQSGHVTDPKSKFMTKKVEFQVENISDELFAPPRPSHDVRVTSLCVITEPYSLSISLSSGNSTKYKNACLAVGVGLRRYDLFSNSTSDSLVQALNSFNQNTSKDKKPLDIMKLEKDPETQLKDDECQYVDESSSSQEDYSCNSNPKNFVPYLLIYDLSQLVQAQNMHSKQNSVAKSVQQGSSKKSTRKAVPNSSSLVKVKGDMDIDVDMNFSVKYSKLYKSVPHNIPNEKSTTSKKVPKCIQCIPLPHKLNKLRLQLFVDLILISSCGQYLLISLKQFPRKSSKENDKDTEETSKLDDANNSSGADQENKAVCGGFILYKIIIHEGSVSLLEEPVASNLFTDFNLVAKEIVMIPDVVYSDVEYEGAAYMAGVICVDGSLRILSLYSLEYVQVIKPTAANFTNISYCHSLERLCVTREDGKVLLMQVKGREDMSDDTEFVENEVSTRTSNFGSNNNSKLESAGDFDKAAELLINKPLNEENLDKCIELTQFEPGCPKFVATVPPCWTEVIQAQKKRRNPQHLQHQSEEIDSARTWRLESDRSFFDEHILDILLPHKSTSGSSGSMQIGHIDVRLNFVNGATQNLPKIQITLLKQNLKSSSKSKNLPNVLDEYTDDFPENPVLTREFLLAHKAEILCGPVTVNNYIDLSGQAANLTLTSPDLFASKGRSFLIHIKVVNKKKEDKSESDCKLDLLPQYVPPQSNAFFDKLSSSTASLKRGEAPKGCEVIQELTLTIHCCARTSIPNERLQRLSMIENDNFHSNLIATIVNPLSSQHTQHRAFDVLLWVLSIHTTSDHNRARRKDLVSQIQENLSGFVRSCILYGDRSWAHKMTKIILTVLESYSDPDERKEFGSRVLTCLLEYLDGIVKCKAAGAVYWYFSLLNHVKWCDPLTTADKITEFLSFTSEALSQRIHPVYSLLQTRFGLYGLPFERDLFDTFPSLLMKQNNSVSSNSNLGGTHGHQHTNSTSSNGNNNFSNSQHPYFVNKFDHPNFLWNSSTTKGYFEGMFSPLGGDNSDLGIILGQNGVTLGLTPQIGGLCGLFEVEPLHFSLHLASDGTKMERVFSGLTNYSTIPYIIQPTSSVDSDFSMTIDNSKWNSLVTPTNQLNKALEDMEHMVMKNHAVAMLLSKKAKKSYSEKLKKAAKLKADLKKALNLGSSFNSPISATTTTTSGQNAHTDSLTADGDFSKTASSSSTSSTLSSDTSPESLPPTSSLIGKSPQMKNTNNSDILGDIVEDVGTILFSTSVLNNSLSLLADVTQDVTESLLQPESDGASDKLVEQVYSQSGIEKENYQSNQFFSKLFDYLLPDSPEEHSNGTLSNGHHIPSFSKNNDNKMILGNLEKKIESVLSNQETDKDKLIEKNLAEELSSPASGKTSTTSTTSTLTKEAKDSGTSIEDMIYKKSQLPSSGLPYQQLLSIPPQQMIVVERMHSGARRFVILDFGAPVVLTDVIIPACSDLVSLTIDIWLKGEETDGERLAVASDIGLRPLVLADLQPPPLCRYLKVTTLGRYGMVTSQCKIPVGAFYGHTVILPWYIQPYHSNVTVTTKKMAKTQLAILSNMVEDVSCRYSLACSKLKSLLQPHCISSNSEARLVHSLNSSASTLADSVQEKKILIAYHECMTEQHHLNLILSVMRRLQKFIGVSPSNDLHRTTAGSGNNMEGVAILNGHSSNSADYRKELESCSSDQLSMIVQSLLNCLLTLSFPPPDSCVRMKLLSWCGPDQAKALIGNVCIRGPKGAQVAVVSLLARLCSGQPWWGEFLATTLVSLFSSRESYEFPATRLFALLTFLGQKSVQCGRGTQVIDAVLQSLLRSTPSADDENHVNEQYSWMFNGSSRQIDPALISWLLLFLSLCLDLITNTKGGDDERGREGGRWSWLTAESSLQKKNSDTTKEAPRDSRDLLRKRLVHHKQQLVNLDAATKSFDEVLTSLGNVINPKMFKQSEQVFKKIQKQHALKHYKDLCSIQRNETNSLRRLSRNKGNILSSTKSKTSKDDMCNSVTTELVAPVDRECCLAVIKNLIRLLMKNAQYFSSVDTFLLTCKVIGGLVRVTRPSLKVSEFLSDEQLVMLLSHSMTLDTTWGSPWAMHALQCLLQDVLEGERLYGSIIIGVQSGEETNVTDNSKGGHSTDALCCDIVVETPTVSQSSATSSACSPILHSRNKNNSSQEDAGTPASYNNNSSNKINNNQTCESVNSIDNEESVLLSQKISLEQSGDISDPCKTIKNDKNLSDSENSNVSAVASVSKSVVSPSGSVNQSATAVSPPAVNIATSHFATIEEEETAGEITFLESDDSSCSNDIIEYLSDLKSDLILLVDQHNTHYSGQALQNKHGGTKDSRVGDLLTASLATQKGKMGTDHSTAVDARLENGISLTAELRIHMMNAVHASKLRSAISAPLQTVSSSWSEEAMYGGGNLKESVKLLSDVFEKTLSHLSYKFEGNQLESLLEIWLNLNLSMAEGEYNPAIIPSIPLYPQSISTLLSAVARSQSISIRCWCLLLQTLTLCSNLTPEEGANGPYFPPTNSHHDNFSSSDLYWMSKAIICDSNFIVVLQKLLSGHFTVGTITRSDVVGSTLTNFLEDLLLRLEVRCDVLSPNSGPGSTLKLTLLTLVMRLLQEPDGPLARGSGPLDIQKTFLTLMLSLNYNGLHKNKTHIPIAIINSVANVVNGFLRSNQEIMSGSPEPNTSVLGGLFASVLGGPDGQQGPIPTRRTILCTLLNLARKLIEVPLEPSTKSTCNAGDSSISTPSGSSNDNSYQERYLTDSVKLEQKHQLGLSSNTTSSQTDEHKALNPLNSPSSTSVEDTSSDFGTSSGNNRNISERNRPRGNSNVLRTDCAHSEEKVACLADLVLQNHETMQMLLQSLKSSESNSSVPMNLIGMVSGDVSERLGIGKTLPDALYHLLVTLNQKTTKNELLLNSLLRFIRPDNLLCQPNFSEALYCFFIQVLDCEGLVKKFSLMHGTELIWENLVKSTDTSCGLQNGFISSVMNHLSPPLPPSTTSSTSHKRIDPSTGSPSTVESSNPKGLYNFAPLAVVTSSNPTARPADSLVKSSQFFQRTKSPPWSYHFYPEENWIDLNFTLPCPILLHEIQLQPHTMSLGMCPSGLSLETGIEGGCLIPVTGLVCTAGLTCIHIALQHPVVASVIVIRLHRPRDQSTLGLSHLKLLGTTTFKNSLKSFSGDSSWDQGSQKSSYWWLRLVDHCMFDVPGGMNIMMESGTRIPGVMEAMVTLLATSSIQPTYPQSAASLNNLSETLANNNYQLIHTLSSTLIENTTLALVNYNQDLLHSLIRCLFSHPFMMQESGFAAVDAAIALLCVVSNANEGVKFLIDWFSKMVDYRSSLPCDESSTSDQRTCMNPKILHCFAAILWNIPDDISSLVTDSLFKKVYDWCEKSSGPIKEGLNYIICSLCKVRPHLFTQLMLFMGFLTVIDSTTSSITDDRKDREAELRASCTDDMKESSEGCGLSGEGRLILQDPSVISITPSHLQTISFAAQSPSTIHLMLDSGFPLLLVHGILEWCKAELLHQVESCTTPNVKESSTDLEKASVSNIGVKSAEGEQVKETTSQSLTIPDALPPLSTGMVVHILEALSAMCSEASMRDWLGSGEGSVFWVPLLTVLGDPVMYGSEISVRTGYGCNYSDYSKVEDATIQLMKVCCSNHDQNRKLLAATLCQLIQRQNTPPPGGLTYLHSLSGFTRRLVLQILLEKECVLVHVTSTFCLSQPPLHTLPPQIKHPKYGTGNKTRLMFLPVTTKIEEVIRMVTDWWQQGTSTQPSQSQNTEGISNADNENGSYKKEISEVGLELVDKLSVAAGVTAKDKRMKDKCSIKINRQKNKKKESSLPKRYNNEKPSGGGQSTAPSYGLLHELILGGSSVVPESMTLGQVLAAVWHHSPSTLHEVSHLKFSLVFAKDACQEPVESPIIESLIKTDPQPSILNVFSSQGGLSILAQHMALLYPDTSHQYVSSISSKSSREERKEKSVDEDMGFHVDMQYSMLPDYYSGNSLGNSPGITRGSALSYFGMMPIPPHSLGSFTLFLRLPGYAETLLTDHTKACCLLRLALGVYDSVYEGEAASFITSLATLPFQILELLLKSTPLTTDDGIMLRKMCLTTGVLHLILACLAVLSHQDGPDVIKALHHPNIPVSLLVATARGSCPSQKQSDANNRNDNERSHYWAKGTGFGTGSTNQSWNVEQALIKQKLEEQHVVWLIKLLAQYINPGDTLPEDLKSLCEEELNNMSQSTQDCDFSTPNTSSAQACLPTEASSTSLKATLPDESGPCLPVELFELLQKAGLITKISSYLSNDSVLDMSRHVPLYQALMSLVRAIAVTPSLAPLFHSSTKIGLMIASDVVKECDDDQGKPVCSSSLPFLLSKMKKTVNTYMAKLKWKAGKVGGSDQYRQGGNRKVPFSEENSSVVEMKDYQNVNDETENEDQGLSLLVPDIQLSTKVVEIIMERLKSQSEENDEKSIQERNEREGASCHLSATDIYLNAMKPLQFDSYEMIIEDSDRGFRFVIPYHYESLVREAGEVFNPKRMKRLAQEAVTLSTSLPLSYSSSVFVRTDMDRLDVMKVLITGPEDTPYANGCFEFDVYFPNFYPNSPLYINLQTTGEKRVRFNPNLYQDGKVCLSILNTWHGRPEEKWNPQTSSLLQVLVSIQSLILVPEPYFNEPGYERSRGSQAALHNSQEYDANIKAATIRWAILNQLRNPSPCFKDVIERHFWLKRKDIMQQVESWITELDELAKNKRAGKAIPHHALAIKKLHQLLEDDFRKMTPPKDLEQYTFLTPSNSVPQETCNMTVESYEDEAKDYPQSKQRHRKTSRADIFAGSKLPVINEWGKKSGGNSSKEGVQTEDSHTDLDWDMRLQDICSGYLENEGEESSSDNSSNYCKKSTTSKADFEALGGNSSIHFNSECAKSVSEQISSNNNNSNDDDSGASNSQLKDSEILVGKSDADLVVSNTSSSQNVAMASLTSSEASGSDLPQQQQIPTSSSDKGTVIKNIKNDETGT